MDAAKRGHRPSLKDWTQDGLAHTFPAWRDAIVARSTYENENYEVQMPPGACHPQRLPALLDGARLSYDQFAKEYETHGIPCVIRNVPVAEGWAATERWQMEVLMQDEDLLERKFKCGEDDDGKNIKVKLRHFLQYMHDNTDDSPLYIFDSGFDEDRVAHRILTDYKVPSFFRDDLFRLVSERRRPPYRWWLVGPERSGTTVHIDPLNTSAWNTLIYGKKRWVLFPPNVPKSIIKGKGHIRKGEDDEAIHYFMNILPRIKETAARMGNTGDYKDFACYEFTQHAGETCFIPLGWWHAVLNLTHTVGITQNFCSPQNFAQVWKKTRSGRKMMAAKWLNALDVHYPQLADHARYMNQRDGFIMKYDPILVKQKEQEKARRAQLKAYEAKMRQEYARQQAAVQGGGSRSHQQQQQQYPPQHKHHHHPGQHHQSAYPTYHRRGGGESPTHSSTATTETSRSSVSYQGGGGGAPPSNNNNAYAYPVSNHDMKRSRRVSPP
eukprot:CAMPEP_0194051230 /NCGR_PEP_ID=MMETSP0009_2-20130614/39299_1 /TAXON_ID=210454 /ORGANISM="Grammatophora oceanica, Strain CCMP 410" /LENGTH=494 /DNA_ID=CAMNT_0038698229 /DNA_START=305 /DNA_END=1789 /DNA_ORIENTATION=-